MQKPDEYYEQNRSELLELIPSVTGSNVLDIGCGAGGFGKLLKEKGCSTIYGIEVIPDIAEKAKAIYDKVFIEDIEDFTPPVSRDFFDLIICADVLEHLKDDSQFLSQIYEALICDGYIFVMVPAFPKLWSSRDVYLGHHRRYTRVQLMRSLEEASFNIVKISYFNFFYLPIMLFLLLMEKTFRHNFLPPDTLTTPDMLNKLLTAIIVLENNITIKINFPLGVSLFCIAQKRSSNT